MDENTQTRRTVIKSLGGLTVAGLVATGQTAASTDGWTVASTPTDRNINDVAQTANGPYAVAGGGIVLRRDPNGWTKVLEGGPTGNGNNLCGAGVTQDGTRLWLVGKSGAIGEYDVQTGSLNDFSAPNDVTNNFNAVAVRGEAGEANVYIAGDSGKIYYSFDNGETFGEVTPGSGSEVNAIDFHGPRSGHAVDGNQRVFETDDGSTYGPIGLEDANVTLYGVDSDGPADVWASGGNGMVFHYDGSGWVPTSTGDATLVDIEVGADGYAVGGGGAVFRLTATGWKQEDTPTGANLNAVLADEAVAVGDSGVIISK